MISRVPIQAGSTEVNGLGRSVEVLTKHLSDLFSSVIHEPIPETLLNLLATLETQPYVSAPVSAPESASVSAPESAPELEGKPI